MLMAGTEIVWDKNNEENQFREIEDTCNSLVFISVSLTKIQDNY